MKNFQQNLQKLEAADTQVLGVSMDSPFANKAFADQIGVKFPLASDWGGEVTRQYGVYVVRCDGRIVFGDEGAALRERVRQMLSGSPRIVVNLNGVHYVDSGGLGILVGLSVSARNRGGELKLASPSQRVSDLLRRTRLEGIISVYRNEKDAVAAFRKQVA